LDNDNDTNGRKGFSFDEIKKMDIFEFYHVLNRLEKDAEK